MVASCPPINPPICVLLFVLCGTLLCRAADILRTETQLPLVVSCVGDSLTAGDGRHIGKVGAVKAARGNYPVFLEEELSSVDGPLHAARVHNFGHGGTMAMTRKLFDSVKPHKRCLSYWEVKQFVQALETQSDVTVFMLGTNDAKMNMQDWGVQFTAGWVKDFTSMLRRLQSSTCGLIVLLPPAVVQGAWEIKEKVLRDKVRPLIKQAYEEWQAAEGFKLAWRKDCKIPNFVGIHDTREVLHAGLATKYWFVHDPRQHNPQGVNRKIIGNDNANGTQLFFDGVHFNAEGSHLLARFVRDALVGALAAAQNA